MPNSSHETARSTGADRTYRNDTEQSGNKPSQQDGESETERQQRDDILVADDGGEILTDGGEEHDPIHMVGYEADADIEYTDTEDGQAIENHDELVEAGKTFEEVRMMPREQIEEFGLEHAVITPDSPMWNDEIADLEPGEAIRLDEVEDDTEIATDGGTEMAPFDTLDARTRGRQMFGGDGIDD